MSAVASPDVSPLRGAVRTKKPPARRLSTAAGGRWRGLGPSPRSAIRSPPPHESYGNTSWTTSFSRRGHRDASFLDHSLDPPRDQVRSSLVHQLGLAKVMPTTSARATRELVSFPAKQDSRRPQARPLCLGSSTTNQVLGDVFAPQPARSFRVTTTWPATASSTRMAGNHT